MNSFEFQHLNYMQCDDALPGPGRVHQMAKMEAISEINIIVSHFLCYATRKE